MWALGQNLNSCCLQRVPLEQVPLYCNCQWEIQLWFSPVHQPVCSCVTVTKESTDTDKLCVYLTAHLHWQSCVCLSFSLFFSVPLFVWFKPAKVEVFWWREKKTALRLAFDSSVLQREKELGKWINACLCAVCLICATCVPMCQAQGMELKLYTIVVIPPSIYCMTCIQKYNM